MTSHRSHRHAYDLSPSPIRGGSRSPTLVNSHVGTDYDDTYSHRHYNRSRSSSETDVYDRARGSRSRDKDRIVKASILIGLFVAAAGLLHLRAKRDRERELEDRRPQYAHRANFSRYDRDDERRRQAEWDDWRENGKKGKLEAPETGRGRRMIEAPDTRSERGSARGRRN